MKYRPEIDGLRALAVIPVILFHAGFELFSGGFVGVDVFFVISGYLITTILIEDIEKQRFSLVSFYEKRTRRILPALFFVVILTLAFSISFLPPHSLKDIGQSVFSVSLFLSNFFFYIETDYFANTSELAPLLHTWSLSVEEQFYIIFPLFLLMLRKFNRNKITLAVASLLIFSLILSEWWVKIDSQFAFYMPFTRFWEIAVGSIIALSSQNITRKKSSPVSEFASLVGLILIMYPVFYFDSKTVFPGINAIPPVLGTALIIIFTNKETVIGKILGIKPLISIGLISYSLYLSHNAVFALSRNIGIPLSSFSTQAALIGISFLIAIISYFLIEKPLRIIDVNRIKYLLVSIIFILALAGAGYVLHKKDGLKDLKLGGLEPNVAKLVINANSELQSRELVQDKFLDSSELPFSNNPDTHNVLILGDSKSDDLYISIVKNYLGDRYQFRSIYLDDTEMVGVDNEGRTTAGVESLYQNQTFVAANEIILTATWQASSNANVVKFIDFLASTGKEISLVSTSNFNDVASLSYVVAKRGLVGSALDQFLFENIRQDWRRQYLGLKKAIQERSLKVRFLEKLDAFCNFGKRTCKLNDGSGWYMYDSGHLTAKGYDYFGRFVLTKWFSE